MKKYLHRILKSIPCIIITLFVLPLIIITQMGPVGNEPGGKATRKAELGLSDWLIKLWGWAWKHKDLNMEYAKHEWGPGVRDDNQCLKCDSYFWSSGPFCSESKLKKL